MEKEMKTVNKISGHIIRGGAWAVFLSVVFIALSSASNSPNTLHKSAGAAGAYGTTGKTSSQPRAFSFAERVTYQRAIEDVYWRHRIWPKENPNPKPLLDMVMSQAQLENKVDGYLRDSLTLENYWQGPITAEQLQAEMDRMARDTKQPEVLRELFEALGNDPAVIAECLARPTLAERLIADFSAQEQTRQVESPQTEALRAMSLATTSGQVVYTLPEIAEAGNTPCTDEWAATTTSNAPSLRAAHTAVWTGSEMIVWGGTHGGVNLITGGRYNPATDSWAATSTTNAPSARLFHTAVWTGREMIIWGGSGHNTGGRYNPGTNSWRATSTIAAPSGRAEHTAVWTGSEMIVWGGGFGTVLNTGGRYNPVRDNWVATSTVNAPSARDNHTAVWTGSEMIVWGGTDSNNNRFNTGGRYNPRTNSWTATSTTNAPAARYLHTAVWTGSVMIVWGGAANSGDVNTGGRYSPSTDTWIATSTTNAPSRRQVHTAVWTGTEMIVWGGAVQSGSTSGVLNTGGRYDPNTNSWIATSTNNTPTPRAAHTAVWTGSEMIVWGGAGNNGSRFNTGGRYCAQLPTLTIIQPNGGEIWAGGSIRQITWDSTNLNLSDHLILQYSRDGGANWFRIAQNIPAFAVAYWWQVDNFSTTEARVRISLQENLSITDESDANFTVQRTP
jgi:N-acetylneuraminic acid mutarotase